MNVMRLAARNQRATRRHSSSVKMAAPLETCTKVEQPFCHPYFEQWRCETYRNWTMNEGSVRWCMSITVSEVGSFEMAWFLYLKLLGTGHALQVMKPESSAEVEGAVMINVDDVICWIMNDIQNCQHLLTITRRCYFIVLPDVKNTICSLVRQGRLDTIT